MLDLCVDMKYQNNRIVSPQIIAKGKYKDFPFYVLNLGTHPCAYVDVFNTRFRYMNYTLIYVFCHGGLTYSNETLACVDDEGWFIGWDYAHYMDRCGEYPGREWSTSEIVEECQRVIEQLVEMGCNDG